MRGHRRVDPPGVGAALVTRPPRRPARGRVALAVIAIGLPLLGGPPRVAAQSAYYSANGAVSLVPRYTGFVGIDFAEARLSLQYVHEFQGAGIGLGPYAAAGARMGQVDLFSAFDFNPGFAAGLLAFKSLGDAARSRDVVFVSLGFRSTQRKLADFAADTNTVELTEEIQRDLTTTLGLNLGLGSRAQLGLAGWIRREWSSPGVAQPVEVCVETVGAGGLTLPSCESRYLVDLQEYWAGQARADVLWNVVALGGARSRPYLALLGSTSLDLGQEADPRWNVGAGVGVAPHEYPGQVIVAVFLELYDVTDANGQAPDFTDRLVARVVLGVPFALLVD